MIVNIFSENPNLMDLLYKNPNTDLGLYAKPMKKGICIGNVVNPNHYEIFFQDKKNSYAPEESGQLDFQNLASPLIIMDICSDFFNHILKDPNEFSEKSVEWLNTTQGAIDTYKCKIEVPTVFLKSNWAKDGKFLLSKYIPKISLQHKVGSNFSLVIEGQNVYEAINLLNLFAVFAHITNDYGVFTYIEEDFAKKYARILTNIKGVPYFVFYLFTKRVVKNPKMFDAVKSIFESYLKEEGYEVNLTFLPTHSARIDYISNQIDRSIPILDVGCGEFLYYKKFMSLGYRQAYFAIDEDENFEKLGEVIAERYNHEELYFYTNIDQFEYKGTVDIILSEVIEHNSKEEAQNLIEKLISLPFRQILITTPNKDFNKYYDENMESRHHDHDFEMGGEEFTNFIKGIAKKYDFIEVVFNGIGDKINGIQTTQACIIKNTNF